MVASKTSPFGVKEGFPYGFFRNPFLERRWLSWLGGLFCRFVYTTRLHFVWSSKGTPKGSDETNFLGYLIFFFISHLFWSTWAPWMARFDLVPTYHDQSKEVARHTPSLQVDHQEKRCFWILQSLPTDHEQDHKASRRGEISTFFFNLAPLMIFLFSLAKPPPEPVHQHPTTKPRSEIGPTPRRLGAVRRMPSGGGVRS